MVAESHEDSKHSKRNSVIYQEAVVIPATRGSEQAHQARGEAQARFQITFDANPAPAMIVRLSDQRVLETNPGLHEVTGRANDDVRGGRLPELGLLTELDLGKFVRCSSSGNGGHAAGGEQLAHIVEDREVHEYNCCEPGSLSACK